MDNMKMQAESHISETMNVYEGIAKYDAAAKNIFKEKKILAHILKDCANEFKDCSIEDIARKYIEGDILVSKVGVNTDTAAKLMRLIYVCLSNMPLEERKNILENEYNIPMTGMEATNMCNLGIGIYNKGIKQGEVIGVEKTEERYSKLVGILTKAKRYDDLDRISEDKTYLHELMEKLVPIDVNS